MSGADIFFLGCLLLASGLIGWECGFDAGKRRIEP